MTVLVVLPGLDGTATLHSAFSEALETTFERVTGVSYPPDQCLNYAELEALVRAVLPAVEPFVLLGESFSGPIALSIAAAPPPNLVGLVLSTTFADSPTPLLIPFAPLTRFAPVRGLPRQVLSWWLLGRWATPQLELALHRALQAVAPDVLRSRASTAMRARAMNSCAKISVPTLYLRASHDRLLSSHAANRLISAIADCTTADIPGPHLLLQAAPQDCARVVRAFSARLGC